MNYSVLQKEKLVSHLFFCQFYIFCVHFSNNIPQECLTTPGATIHLLVYDQDKLLRDDFAGEATIALSSIPQLNDDSCTTFDKTPTTILALRRPQMTSRALQVRCFLFFVAHLWLFNKYGK